MSSSIQPFENMVCATSKVSSIHFLSGLYDVRYFKSVCAGETSQVCVPRNFMTFCQCDFFEQNYNFFFATLELSLSFMAFSEFNAQF